MVGDPLGRVTQLVLMSPMATGARQHRALVQGGTLTAEVYRVDGWGAVENCCKYVLAAHEDDALGSLFRRAAQRVDPRTGGEIMSIADRLRAEGKVEVLEGFLKAGASWEMIEAATGLDEPAFQALREQVAVADPQARMVRRGPDS